MRPTASVRNIIAAFALGTCLGIGSNFAHVEGVKTFVAKTIWVIRDSEPDHREAMK